MRATVIVLGRFQKRSRVGRGRTGRSASPREVAIVPAIVTEHPTHVLLRLRVRRNAAGPDDRGGPRVVGGERVGPASIAIVELAQVARAAAHVLLGAEG